MTMPLWDNLNMLLPHLLLLRIFKFGLYGCWSRNGVVSETNKGQRINSSRVSTGRSWIYCTSDVFTTYQSIYIRSHSRLRTVVQWSYGWVSLFQLRVLSSTITIFGFGYTIFHLFSKNKEMSNSQLLLVKSVMLEVLNSKLL